MRILIIEDDVEFCSAITFILEKDNYVVDKCHDGETGLLYIKQKVHDLILLDRMLPNMDGLSILRQIRGEGINIPVLIITALGKTNDLVEGLDYGADDYIVKPFENKVLLARVRAMLRRPREIEDLYRIEYKYTVFEPNNKKIYTSNKSTSLSTRECSLMKILMRRPSVTVSRYSLFAYVWGSDSENEDGILDTYISFLRRRLKTIESEIMIVTVRGVGYKIE